MIIPISKWDKRKLWGVSIALLNAISSLFIYLFEQRREDISLIVAFCMILFCFQCINNFNNLLILTRNLILGLIGYFPIVIKTIFGSNTMFSILEPTSQGLDVTIVMFVFTSIALFSSQIGFACSIASRRTFFVYFKSAEGEINSFQNNILLWKIAMILGFCLCLLSSFIFVKVYNSNILTTGYASEEQGIKSLPFGSAGILGSFGVFVLFVVMLKNMFSYAKYLFIIAFVFFVLFSQILMGVRQDAISTIFGLAILFGVVKKDPTKVRFVYLPIIFAVIIFFEFWGVARTAIAGGVPILEILKFTFTKVGEGDAIEYGTVSPIANTFSSTIFLIKNQKLDYTWGYSYLEWLLRIPPEVIYANRPKDYAWMFDDFGLRSGGGFFESAEIYMNFGLVGALFVPGIISFYMGRVYNFALKMQSFLGYCMLFSILAIFLRGTWYQTFAFFRSFQVCLLIYITCLLLWSLRANFLKMNSFVKEERP